MRSASTMVRSTAVLVALAAVTPLFSQTFAATTGPDAVIGTPEPRAVRITVPGHHRRTEEKLLYGRVRDGVYTVDGMTAKVQLNYDVNGVNFLYLFVPGIGTALVSASPDPDAVVIEAVYKDNDLSFQAGDHRFHLTGVALTSDKGAAPAHLYVKLDRSAWHLNRHPMIGFGNMGEMPYVWPGALPASAVTSAEVEQAPVAPPLPASLLPSAKTIVPAQAPAAVSPGAPHPVALR